MKPSDYQPLWVHLWQLSERERFIVRHRYGLDGEAPWSLAACGRALGVGRERVRQLEGRALRMLARLQARDPAGVLGRALDHQM